MFEKSTLTFCLSKLDLGLASSDIKMSIVCEWKSISYDNDVLRPSFFKTLPTFINDTYVFVLFQVCTVILGFINSYILVSKYYNVFQHELLL